MSRVVLEVRLGRYRWKLASLDALGRDDRAVGVMAEKADVAELVVP
jgi:hypothetical protein